VIRFITLPASFVILAGSLTAQTPPAKKTALDLVDKQRGDLVAMSDRVWELAETALREEQSAKVLSDYAEAKGFTVQRGVAGMPTAFVASYGQGRPVIAIMASTTRCRASRRRRLRSGSRSRKARRARDAGTTCSALQAWERPSRSRN
jgi:hypothetical protein